MVPKDALSAREPGDARGFDPGGPGTRNSPMENPPTMSAVDQKPAVENGESKIKYPENPGVTHGKSGTNDTAKAPQSSPAPQS